MHHQPWQPTEEGDLKVQFLPRNKTFPELQMITMKIILTIMAEDILFYLSEIWRYIFLSLWNQKIYFLISPKSKDMFYFFLKSEDMIFYLSEIWRYVLSLWNLKICFLSLQNLKVCFLSLLNLKIDFLISMKSEDILFDISEIWRFIFYLFEIWRYVFYLSEIWRYVFYLSEIWRYVLKDFGEKKTYFQISER